MTRLQCLEHASTGSLGHACLRSPDIVDGRLLELDPWLGGVKGKRELRVVVLGDGLATANRDTRDRGRAWRALAP